MRPALAELARMADDSFISGHTKAGLSIPTNKRGRDRVGDRLSGGGTTPAHIAAVSPAIRPFAPRSLSHAGAPHA